MECKFQIGDEIAYQTNPDKYGNWHSHTGIVIEIKELQKLVGYHCLTGERITEPFLQLVIKGQFHGWYADQPKEEPLKWYSDANSFHLTLLNRPAIKVEKEESFNQDAHRNFLKTLG